MIRKAPALWRSRAIERCSLNEPLQLTNRFISSTTLPKFEDQVGLSFTISQKLFLGECVRRNHANVVSIAGTSRSSRVQVGGVRGQSRVQKRARLARLIWVLRSRSEILCQKQQS